MRDKYTIKRIELIMADNGGWVAFDRNHETAGAFTTKKDLLEWLDDNLRYAAWQHEDDEKSPDDAT